MSTIESIVPGGVGTFGSTPFSPVGGGIFDESSRPSRCAYSLDGDTWVEFPVGPRFDLALGVEEQDVALEADRGRRFVYRQYQRDKFQITLRFEEADRAAVRAFHDAVSGQLSDFYLSIASNGVPVALILGRKTKGMLPAGISIPTVSVIYEYRFAVIGTVIDTDAS